MSISGDRVRCVTSFGMVGVILGLIFLSFSCTSAFFSLTANPGNIVLSASLGATSSPATVTVMNAGNESVTITSVSVVSTGGSNLGSFSVAPASGVTLPYELRPGASVSFMVTYTAKSGGQATGVVALTTSATQSTVDVAGVSGSAIASLLSLSATNVAFGNVTVGTNAAQTIQLINKGTGTLTISQITGAPTGVALQYQNSIPANSSTPLTATWSPGVAGSLSGNLTITSNASNSPATVTLSGNAGTSPLMASSMSIAFGTVGVGSSNSQTVTLTNGGVFPITISQVAPMGTGFSVSGLQVPQTLTAGQVATLTVGFSPTTSGLFSETYSVISNATSSPTVLQFSGTAALAGGTLTISPATLPFGNVPLCSSTGSTLMVMASNTGSPGSTITISQAPMITSVPNDFVLAPPSLPITLTVGGSAAVFSIDFTPTVVQAYNATFTVTSDASNSPTASTLTGSGTHCAELQWTPDASQPSGVTVTSYNIYRQSSACTGTGTGGKTVVGSVNVPTTTFIDPALTGNTNYCYAVTAVASGVESTTASPEAQASIPGP